MKKRPTKPKKSASRKSQAHVEAKDEQALLLPLSLIKPIKNIREKLEDIESLAESIRVNGLLQPLIISRDQPEVLKLCIDKAHYFFPIFLEALIKFSEMFDSVERKVWKTYYIWVAIFLLNLADLVRYLYVHRDLAFISRGYIPELTLLGWLAGIGLTFALSRKFPAFGFLMQYQVSRMGHVQDWGRKRHHRNTCLLRNPAIAHA